MADLVSDPRWVGLGWRTLVLEHGLRAVCSTPIVSLTGTVLGTFAIYQREPGPPSALLKDLIARFTHVASIAIERAISEREQKRADAEIMALKDQLLRENLVLRDEVDRTSMFEEIVGTSPALQPVLARLAKVAHTDSTVLITGETGTGKELVARAIHRRSARSAQSFVSVNCAVVPRELGIGALRPREGCLHRCHAAAPRSLRTGARRNHLPRRSRRAADGDPGRAAPRSSGA